MAGQISNTNKFYMHILLFFPQLQTFLGQKYGYRPFPAKIVAAEFETVLEAVSESKNKEVLSRWFYRDENSVPPVYVLQPITVHLPHFNDNIDVEKRREARKEWWEQFEAMQVILRQAASTKLSEIDAAKYFISGKIRNATRTVGNMLYSDCIVLSAMQQRLD